MLSRERDRLSQDPNHGRRRLILAVATWGGVGFLPFMPGTWGTLAAVPLWWLLAQSGPWGYGLGVAALLVMALWAAGPAQEYLGRKDHPAIVVDEVAGLLVALAWTPVKWQWILIGFVLFRLFDIWKPFPVKYWERLPGGWGVVLDDLAAGLLARGVLAVIMIFGGRG